MIYKIDIEKVFDSVEWLAIIATLRRMKFLDTWITWIQSYLSSASFSLLSMVAILIGLKVLEVLDKVTLSPLSCTF